MHPVFSRKGALGPYLAVWVPLAGILAAVLALPGQVSWSEALALAVPLALLYAVIGLSTWYVCRAAPLGIAGLLRLVTTHLVAAVALSGLWLGLGWGAVSLLTQVPALADLPDRLAPGMPVLWAVGILFYLLSAAGHYLLVAFEASGAAERREGELRLQAREAELRALKAQVNPHFLFNSLNSISSLAGSDAGRAREMCVLLSDFLRMSLGLGERDRVTLGEELDLAGTFLGVEKVRLGPRLTVEMDVEDGCRTCPVTPLLLQPLVENAVIHGIAGLAEGGLLRIEARRAGDRLRLVVENPYDPGRPARRGGGLGLDNVRRRLAARYGGDARMEVEAADGRYRVALHLPVRRGED
jgi:hypothetical protein